jgi:heptosyltransferase-2
MKILLAKRRALGDTIFLSSTISNLAAALPGAEIYALVPGAFAPMLVGHPSLKGLYTFEEGFLSLIWRLRAARFDHFIQLHSSPSQRIVGRFAGAFRVSHSVQNNETEKAYGKHPNALEWDGFYLRTLFGDSVAVPGPAPKIYLEKAELEEGKRYWKSQGVDPARVVFFGLGASRPTKRWSPAHFARLGELLCDRLEMVPAFIPGPGDTETLFAGQVLDEMRARGLRSIGSGGKGDFVHGQGLPVRALAGALAAVRAYVGNDSGPKHLAAAVGLPTVTFFGPEDPVEWHPYSRDRHAVLFQAGLICRKEDEGRWCGLETCNLTGSQRHRCMVDLSPLDALAELQRVLL